MGGKVVFAVPGTSSHLQTLFGKPEQIVKAEKGEVVWDYPKLRLAALISHKGQVTALELRSAHQPQRLHD